MNTFLIAANLLLGALLIAAIWRIWQQRIWLNGTKAELGNFKAPIPQAELHDIDPVFRRGEFGPTLDAEVFLLGGGVIGGTSETEAWILAALSKSAERMFEFGTATGRTTYLWARNSPARARIWTITLHPDQSESYSAAAGDTSEAKNAALSESRFSRMYYNGTPVEHKVTQLYGDSKTFDDAPYAEQFDLIFIDGSHAYSYVKSDTEKALRMIKDGGLILWHDYRKHWTETIGVFRFLNELSESLPLHRVGNTALVCYRKPASSAAILSNSREESTA
jgi:Methyltransferase domain